MRELAVRRGARVAAAVFVLAAVQCVAGAAGAASSPKVPDGYETTRLKTAALVLTLPDSWLKLDPRNPDVLKELAKTAKRNPEFADLITQFKQQRGSIKLWAIDTKSTTYSTNLIAAPANVPTSALDEPAQIEDALRSNLPSARDVHAETTSLPGADEVLRLTYSIDVAAADGRQVTAYGTMFFVPTPKGVMHLTYSSDTPPDQDDVLDTFSRTLRALG